MTDLIIVRTTFRSGLLDLFFFTADASHSLFLMAFIQFSDKEMCCVCPQMEKISFNILKLPSVFVRVPLNFFNLLLDGFQFIENNDYILKSNRSKFVQHTLLCKHPSKWKRSFRPVVCTYKSFPMNPFRSSLFAVETLRHDMDAPVTFQFSFRKPSKKTRFE